MNYLKPKATLFLRSLIELLAFWFINWSGFTKQYFPTNLSRLD